MSREDRREIPSKGVKRGAGKLPIRNFNSSTDKENQSSLDRAPPPAQNSSVVAAPSGGLQFINLLGTEKHDSEGRNTVRSHARRHAWKNQRRGHDKKETLANKTSNNNQLTAPPAKVAQVSRIASAPTIPTSQAYLDECSKFQEAARRLPQRASSYPSGKAEHVSSQVASAEPSSSVNRAVVPTHQLQVGQRGITNAHSDPFNVFPVPLTPKLQHLIHYSRGVQNVLNENTTDTFSNQLGNSPSLIYATLAWTTSLSTPARQARSPESEYYLSQSIMAINEDLKQSQQKGLSDGTIAAVACLSNMENIIGDKTKAQIHMNGLQHMIATRGGINALGLNDLLRRLVLWADVLNASRWQTTPRFHLSLFPDLLSLPSLEQFRPPSAPKPQFTVVNPALIDAINRTANQALFHIMRETHDLAHFVDTTLSTDPGLLERASFSDRVYLVEHKLLVLIADNAKYQTRDSIMMPLLHSLLLYIYTNIRLTPIEGQIRLVLVARLQQYLQECDMFVLSRDFPHEIRWIHFLGGAAATKDTPERLWFVRSLVDCGCRSEWALWDHIVPGLKGFETAFLHRCEEYWKEVDDLKRADGHFDGRHGPSCFSGRQLVVTEIMGE